MNEDTPVEAPMGRPCGTLISVAQDGVVVHCGDGDTRCGLCARIAELEDESRRFYHADGTYDTLESAEAVVTMRIECAKVIERITRERDAILMEARVWAGEAKTQRATVNEVGSALGGVLDWGPIAAKIRERINRPACEKVCEAVGRRLGFHQTQARSACEAIRNLYAAKDRKIARHRSANLAD